MTASSTSNFPELYAAAYRAAGKPALRGAVGEIYQNLQAEIEKQKPLCSASGRCCHFEDFGHRLYVTTAELGTFLFEQQTRTWPGDLDSARASWDGTGCPFQSGGLCGVHPIRPFGCRIFFCDPSAAQWQTEQYERFHASLKALHEVHEIPYFYVEWRAAIAALGL